MLALVAATSLVAALAQAADAYDLADLQALAKDGDPAVLVAHLDDIRPSKRDAAWDHLVEVGALGLVAQKAKGPDAMDAWATVQDLSKRYPALAKSKPFLDAARPVVLAGGAACYGLDTQDLFCNQTLLADVQRDAALSIDVGKLVIHHQFPYFAVPYFAPAVEVAKMKGACDVEELQRSVLAALGLPSEDSKVPIAARLATGACAAQFKDALAKGLADSGYFKVNACAALKAKKLLDDYQRVQCGEK